MQSSTDAQKKRRADTLQGTAVIILFMLMEGLVPLVLRYCYSVGGILGAVLLIVGIVNLGAIIPVCILLKQRMKEIQGGEEDAAAQY